uniref:Uncharacterized protein n=1 Tax=Heterorhabditis bacteriophora TaxID=37862 RepID=A0A1I7WZL0_HETBA
MLRSSPTFISKYAVPTVSGKRIAEEFEELRYPFDTTPMQQLTTLEEACASFLLVNVVIFENYKNDSFLIYDVPRFDTISLPGRRKISQSSRSPNGTLSRSTYPKRYNLQKSNTAMNMEQMYLHDIEERQHRRKRNRHAVSESPAREYKGSCTNIYKGKTRGVLVRAHQDDGLDLKVYDAVTGIHDKRMRELDGRSYRSDKSEKSDEMSLHSLRRQGYSRSNEKMPVSVGISIVFAFISGACGAVLFSWWEGWNPFDGAYYCFITLRKEERKKEKKKKPKLREDIRFRDDSSESESELDDDLAEEDEEDLSEERADQVYVSELSFTAFFITSPCIFPFPCFPDKRTISSGSSKRDDDVGHPSSSRKYLHRR